jgi:hypothetical protein
LLLHPRATVALVILSAPVYLAGGVHTPIAQPPLIVAGAPTTVTISTYIPDSTLIPNSVNLVGVNSAGQSTAVIGQLNDNGQNGDAVAGDHVYSISVPLSNVLSPSITFGVSAAFLGMLRRETADVTIPVLSIPAIVTIDDFNEQMTVLFNNAFLAQTALSSLAPGQSPKGSDVLTAFEQAEEPLEKVYTSLAAVVSYASSEIGPTNSVEDAALRGGVMKRAVTARSVPGIIPGSDAINIPLQLVNVKMNATEVIMLFAADGDDPRVPPDLVTYAETMCGLSDLSSPDPDGLRLACVEMWEQGNPNGAFNQVRQIGSTAGIQEALGPVEDFFGDLIGTSLQLGPLATQAVTGVVGQVIDLFPISTAHASGIILSQISNPGTLQVPDGTNTLIYSFGGGTPPAVLSDVQATGTGTTPTVDFAPGETLALSAQPPTHFVLTRDMTTPRLDHTATLLNNGMVLIAGGVGGTSGEFLATAELYDPASATFAATGSMHYARSEHTATLLSDGRVLIVGGTYNTAAAEIYNPSSGTFSITGTMSTPRVGNIAVLLNSGKVLVAGGVDAVYLTSAELYDPSLGIFTPVGSMTTFRQSPSATLLASGNVLIAGGFPVTATAELYNSSTATFVATGSLTIARGSQTATLLTGGKVLVTGGIDFGFAPPPVLATAELYDPTAGSFTTTSSMSVARIQHTATALLDGSVMVVGGFNSSIGRIGTSEIFNPAANSFSAGPSLNTPRSNHTATLLVNGTVLIAGGEGPSGPLATAELAQ